MGKALSKIDNVTRSFYEVPNPVSVARESAEIGMTADQLIQSKKKEKEANNKLKQILSDERRQLEDIRIEKKRVWDGKLTGSRSMSGGSARVAGNNVRMAKGGVLRVSK